MKARDWISQWTTPAVIITLLGMIFAGVVWGIQLNITVLHLTKSMTINQAKDARQDEALIEAREMQIRTAVIMDSLERRVTANFNNIDGLHDENARWKEKIIQNSSTIRGFRNPLDGNGAYK